MPTLATLTVLAPLVPPMMTLRYEELLLVFFS
jgi:hypothetical protein